MENQPDPGQTGRGGAGPNLAFDQRPAQLREVPETKRPGSQPLPAEHVEQSVLAAVRRGDDADGAVVHLRAAAQRADGRACGDRYQLRLPVLRAGPDIRPAEPGVQHAAGTGRVAAKHAVPVDQRVYAAKTQVAARQTI